MHCVNLGGKTRERGHAAAMQRAMTDKTAFFTASFESPSKYGSRTTNPFAAATANLSRSNTAIKTVTDSPTKRDSTFQPPHSSFFNPKLPQPSAPSFRNPAFNTPQRPHASAMDPLASDMSGVEYETSPGAMTDTSEMPADTPDADSFLDAGTKTITPSVGRSLFSRAIGLRSRTPGRGEIVRAGDRSSRVHKRKRQQFDRDVGGVRQRMEDAATVGMWVGQGTDGGQRQDQDAQEQRTSRRWLGDLLHTVTRHPQAPAILAEWIGLGVNFILVSGTLTVLWFFITMVRMDIGHANQEARAKLLHEVAQCSRSFVDNQCEVGLNLPAIRAMCEEWQLCMQQDTNAIKRTMVSAKSATIILNEVVDTLSWKTWVCFITFYRCLSLFFWGFFFWLAACLPSIPLY
jgi:hypothetical protein